MSFPCECSVRFNFHEFRHNADMSAVKVNTFEEATPIIRSCLRLEQRIPKRPDIWHAAPGTEFRDIGIVIESPLGNKRSGIRSPVVSMATHLEMANREIDEGRTRVVPARPAKCNEFW